MALWVLASLLSTPFPRLSRPHPEPLRRLGRFHSIGPYLRKTKFKFWPRATTDEAQELLKRFDREQILSSAKAEGLAKGKASNEFSANWTDNTGLWNSIERLTGEATSLVFGICAGSAEEGLEELKGLVGTLAVKRGRLHGMDTDGVPRDMREFGPVFIRYVSGSGDAYLSGYDGTYRGIYFTPTLPDGEFRQYGVLPLGLWKEANRTTSSLSPLEASVRIHLDKIRKEAEALGLSLELTSAMEDGGVEIRCSGDKSTVRSLAVRRWLEANIMQVSGVQYVSVIT